MNFVADTSEWFETTGTQFELRVAGTHRTFLDVLDLAGSEELVVNLQTGHLPREALSISDVLVFAAADPEVGADTQGV